MKKELLEPDELSLHLAERILKLEIAEKKLQISLKKAPEGSLFVHKKGQYVQYALKSEGEKKLTYLSKNKMKLIKSLQQKYYEEKVLSEVEEELYALKKMQKIIDADSVNKVYEKMSPERKALTIPVTYPHKIVAEEWMSMEYIPKEFCDESVALYTHNGLRVRSKSEVIIAETLTAMGVPFHYEYPVDLSTEDGIITVHPDFYCMNIRTRQTFYWEHFGIMEDPAYSINTARKIHLYNRNKIFPGHNLIITMETKEQPLSGKDVKLLIQEYLV